MRTSLVHAPLTSALPSLLPPSGGASCPSARVRGGSTPRGAPVGAAGQAAAAQGGARKVGPSPCCGVDMWMWRRERESRVLGSEHTCVCCFCSRHYLHIPTRAFSHLHPHTSIPTRAFAHLHPHTCIPTRASPHAHPHTCIPTHAFSHSPLDHRLRKRREEEETRKAQLLILGKGRQKLAFSLGFGGAK